MNKFPRTEFEYKKWHPLKDLPAKSTATKPDPAVKQNDEMPAAKNDGNADMTAKYHRPDTTEELLNSLPSNAKILLGNITINPALTVKQRMEELDFSGRAFESAKNELVVRKLIIESIAGRKKYLIPTAYAYACFGLVCPYKNTDFDEHSFYLDVIGKSFRKNKLYKSVKLEGRVNNLGSTGDVITQGIDGTLEAFEYTSSVTNIVQNCAKYEACHGFKKITFICKSSDILKAVKSKVLNAGLPVELLGKIEYSLLSSILKD